MTESFCKWRPRVSASLLKLQLTGHTAVVICETSHIHIYTRICIDSSTVTLACDVSDTAYLQCNITKEFSSVGLYSI